jgi:hypothetical protein
MVKERVVDMPHKWKTTFWTSSSTKINDCNIAERGREGENEFDLSKLSLGSPVLCRKGNFEPQANITYDLGALEDIHVGANLLDLRHSEKKRTLASLRPIIKSSLYPSFGVTSMKILSHDEIWSEPEVDAESKLKRMSVIEDLQEFRLSDKKIMIFPDYLTDADKEIVKQVADRMCFGYQCGEKNITVFNLTKNEKPSVIGRHLACADDVFVNVSELAQQGKDGFIAKLRLRRLDSGSGMRRNMLWDVVQHSQTGSANPVSEGDGGVYAVQSSSGQKLAMFKPTEEERFVREGLYPGEGAVREEAAYVLDSRMGGFSGVPPTAVARLQLSTIGQVQSGAVQRFMASNVGSMEDFGMPFDLEKAKEFVPVEQVHRIGILDIRVFNTDRHPGNILLIGDKAPYSMAPIDHGCILPSWFALSEARFDWLEYPQCKVPFSPQEMDHIEALNAEKDAIALRKLGIREECVTTLKICALLLKKAAKAGKTLYWIGNFMQRSGCFENPSDLEKAIEAACKEVGIPFEFFPNEFQEKKGKIELGLLSRRPPTFFFEKLDQLLDEAITRQ